MIHFIYRCLLNSQGHLTSHKKQTVKINKHIKIQYDIKNRNLKYKKMSKISVVVVVRGNDHVGKLV